MSSSNGAPTETSPLLAKSKSLQEVDPIPIDPGAGFAPEGIHSSESDLEDGAPPGADDTDGGDLERQVTNEGRIKQYEGMPEVKKKMKYILPAVAIGVSRTNSA